MTEEPSATDPHAEPTPEVEPDPAAIPPFVPDPAPEQPKERTFTQRSLVLGVVIGAVVAVVLGGCIAGAAGLVMYRTWTSSFENVYVPGENIEIAPVEAGEPWFDLADDGTGVIEGWSYGSSGSDDTSVYFDVYAVGAVDDVMIQHVVSIQVDENTEFFVGDKAWEPSRRGSGSDAEALFSWEDSGEDTMWLEESLLKVEVRRDGKKLLATKVTADPDGQPSPLMY